MSTPIEQNTIDLQAILDAVNALPNAGGGTDPAEPVIRELTVSENGTYIAPDGVDGYSPVTVNVPEPDTVLQEKSVTPTTSQQIVEPDNGYDGLSKVNVGAIPSSYIQPSGTKNITENGTHDVKSYASVEVDVPSEDPVLQSKTVTPTTSQQSVKPDNGYDGLSEVKVGAIPSNYIVPSGSMTITQNGTHDVREKASVTVAVETGSGGGSDTDGILKSVIERTCANITLPADLTSIGSHAFYQCVNLALTSLPYGVTSIGNNAFGNCLNLALTSLPDGVTSIGDSAFYQCKNLALTSLPDGVTSITRYAFYGCSRLALTSLPDGLTSIANDSFNGCFNLALTSLPDGLTSIGSNAFNYCTDLETITFKGTPTSISSSAFSNCEYLVTINVPWSEGAVANAPWGATNATINYNYTEG